MNANEPDGPGSSKQPAEKTFWDKVKEKLSISGFLEKIVSTFAQTALGVLVAAGGASAAMAGGVIPWQSAAVQGGWAAASAVVTSFGTLLIGERCPPVLHALILGAVTWGQSLFGTFVGSKTDPTHIHFVFSTAAYAALVAAALAVLKAFAGLANPATQGASVAVKKR